MHASQAEACSLFPVGIGQSQLDASLDRFALPHFLKKALHDLRKRQFKATVVIGGCDSRHRPPLAVTSACPLSAACPFGRRSSLTDRAFNDRRFCAPDRVTNHLSAASTRYLINMRYFK